MGVFLGSLCGFGFGAVCGVWGGEKRTMMKRFHKSDDGGTMI